MKIKEKIINKTQSLPDAGLVNHFFDFRNLSLENYPDKVILFGQSEVLSEMNKYSEVHNRFCLIVAVTGGLRVIVEGAPIYIREGEGILLFPYQNHSFPHEDKNSVLFFITFEQENLSEIEALRSHRFGVTEKMERVWEQIFESWENLEEEPEKIWSLSPAIRQFLLAGCEQILRDETPELFTELRRMFKKPEFMTWKVKEVANHFDCSAGKLNRICKESLGTSLGEYLRNLRFDYSVNLICSTELEIKQVANQSGFQSFATFCRQYRQRFNETPLSTRKRFQCKEFRLRYDGF